MRCVTHFRAKGMGDRDDHVGVDDDFDEAANSLWILESTTTATRLDAPRLASPRLALSRSTLAFSSNVNQACRSHRHAKKFPKSQTNTANNMCSYTHVCVLYITGR